MAEHDLIEQIRTLHTAAARHRSPTGRYPDDLIRLVVAW